MEHLFLEVQVKGVKALLGVVYAPPGVNYFDTLEQLLDVSRPQYDHVIMLGNFNTCLVRKDTRCNKLVNIATSYNISILDLDTTIHVNDINTKLDLILTGDSKRISTYGQFPAPGFSHHDLIFASIKLKSPKQRPRVVMQRNFAAVDYDRLRIDAEALDWSQLYNACSIDDMVTAFNKNLTALYDKHAPIVPVRMKRRPAPWLTDGIRQLMAKRNSLYRRYRKSPCDDTFSKFKKARNRCNQMIRNAKRRNISSAIEDCTADNVWKVLHGLGFGKSKCTADPPVSVDDLNRHFTSVPFQLSGVAKEATIDALARLPIDNYTAFSFIKVNGNECRKSGVTA
ncbi:reverse transcriptase [Operophtera brumata]|uniref:Reverse transcriptase n=1 Tax=Operophtera brumata TaxID=104452 RepID=A0A0L7LEW7_OPEBR|nr:reverse transcriptase [Operophtera brumata]